MLRVSWFILLCDSINRRDWITHKRKPRTHLPPRSFYNNNNNHPLPGHLLKFPTPPELPHSNRQPPGNHARSQHLQPPWFPQKPSRSSTMLAKRTEGNLMNYWWYLLRIRGEEEMSMTGFWSMEWDETGVGMDGWGGSFLCLVRRYATKRKET